MYRGVVIAAHLAFLSMIACSPPPSPPTPTQIVIVVTATPASTQTPTQSPLDARRVRMIEQAYRDLLGRDPDPAGLTVWYESGQEEAQIRAGIQASPEYLTRVSGAGSGASSPPAAIPSLKPTPVTPTQAPIRSASPTSTASDRISWNDARANAGKRLTVCGPVADTNYASGSNGAPTFLNLGVPFPRPERFTVLIWGRNRGAFPTPPERLYLSKTICVTGLIETFQGIPQIEAMSPTQIVAQ